jgi:DNA polymerase V
MDYKTPLKKIIGLADCNNFFVSCERVFRPDLEGKPVVVLSSNDGCVISRSNEAKALNIPMGIAYFKMKEYMQHHGVTVFSGNMELYQDFSSRVMACLKHYSDQIEQYSIDESFFSLAIASLSDPLGYCRNIRRAILRNTGIPVSIGISTTKTLCKIASELAKQRSKKDPRSDGVYMLMPADAGRVFPYLELKDIWGIGRRSAERLNSAGIRTVPQLLREDESRIRRILSIRGVLTVRELRGIPCFSLEENAPQQQSLQVSRSFGQRLMRYEDIEAMVVKHAAEGAYRLRSQQLCAGVVGCILLTSQFIKAPYLRSAEIPLAAPTSRDSDIIAGAIKCLKKIFIDGYQYAKTGIYLNNLCSDRCRQMNIFEAGGNGPRQDRLMNALDQINRKFGRAVIAPAVIKCALDCEPRHALRSAWSTRMITAKIEERTAAAIG